ncbi:RHS repeat-associated core domain-containing protein [Flavobacterium agricola]|uniref:RHS repeat-associated core domain-containing protein n=1 Tax=Flavobacterium agricola TaxID=2870839 RepID=A0ABY6M0B9_9FLAO|nr:RHS repeat-associated core domain-containing protein [Flavobacterium agricola]UYW02002.1 RHS repeat-associated core domain-containing protein [Flavobacterium agricola]
MLTIYNESGRLLSKKTTGKSNLEVFYTYSPALKNLLIKEEGTNEGNSFANTVNYDNYFRISEQTNTTPYFSFKEIVNYDAIGRVNNSSSEVIKDGQILQNVTLNHQYNPYNGEVMSVKEVTNGTVGKTIWEVTLKSQRGEALKQKLGEAIFVEHDFDLYGNLINIRNRNETQWLSNKEYQYQVDRGLLIKRKDTHFGWEENFTYDTFDRLLTWSSPLGTNSNTYISDGRINQNSQVGQYSYNTAAKYKKETIALNENGASYYNNRSTQTVVYDGFKRPLNIKEENRGIIDFEYGINSSRIKAVKNNLITNEKTTKYYAPNGTVEIAVDENQNAKIINYLGSPYETPYIYITDVNLNSKIKSNESFYYLGRDFQGSITEVFDANGSFAIERRLFDPWGNVTKLENNVSHNYAEGENAYLVFLDRGYTGHEHFNEVGIIHMNGRIYDPILKQFLSPDNFIQDPSNSQNYNRYGYAWNNPLKYIDPSGELFGMTVFAAAVVKAAVVSAFAYTMVGLTTWTEFSALGLLKSTTIGAVSGAVSFGIGNLVSSFLSNLPADYVLTKLDVGLITGTQAVMHGISQGFISGITGGSFETSFVSAMVSSLVSTGVEFTGVIAGIGDSGTATILFGTASGAIAAKLTNGNVWQGAAVGFFVSALNHAAHKIVENIELDEFAKTAFGEDYKVKYGVKSLKWGSQMKKGEVEGAYYNPDNQSIINNDSRVGGINTPDNRIYISDIYKNYPLHLEVTIGHELIHSYHRTIFGNNYSQSYSEHAAYQYSIDFTAKHNMARTMEEFQNFQAKYKSNDLYNYKLIPGF